MAQAMLDCDLCGTRQYMTVEGEQLNSLHSTGAAQVYCQKCRRQTLWSYGVHDRRSGKDRRMAPRALFVPHAQTQAAVEPAQQPGSAYADLAKAAIGTHRPADRRAAQQRGQRRVPLELPVRVRVQEPQERFEETTRTANVCRGGIYLYSDKPYRPDLTVHVALNYADVVIGGALEQRGRVVRVDELPLNTKRGVAIQLL